MMRHPAVRPAFAWLAGFLILATTTPASAAELPSDLDLVPRDAAAFFHMRVADVYKAEWMTLFRHFVEKSGPEAMKIFQERYAPDPFTVDRVTLVMLTPQSFQDPFPSADPEAVSALVIVTTSKPYDRKRLVETFGSREKKYKKQTYAFNEDLWSGLAIIDDRTFLIGSEDALVQFWDHVEKSKKDGPLQSALLTAAGKQQLTVGLNPQLLGKGAGAFLPPPLSKLLESRCATLTLNIDKDIRSGLRLEYARDDEAVAGAKALRESIDMGRELLKQPIAEMEKVLKKNPNKAQLTDITENYAALLGLGLLREVDTLLKDAPIQAKGPVVTMDLTYKGMQSVDLLVVGGSMASLVGRSSSRTFAEVGQKLGGFEVEKDPHTLHLKKIAEALERYQADKGTYPPPVLSSQDGKPLMSWRVALLPYLGDEEKALYKEFKLDEPWDSLHNKKLLKKLPKVYQSPSAHHKLKTATQVFSGDGAVFGPKGTKKGDIKPGAALLVEGNSETMVYWAKPADHTLVQGKEIPKIFGRYGYQSIHVLFADGTVREFRQDNLDEAKIREMAKPSGTKLDKPDEEK